jgi:hypothetical protein
MKMISKVALAAVGALALSAGAASAEIVCNDDGDCWHVRHHMDYPAGIRLHVHPDHWRWGGRDHYRWREHAGHGYWRSGVWVDVR